MNQFGDHFERYKTLRKLSVAESTLRCEEVTHKYLWKFLEEKQFKGNELDIKRENLLEYCRYVNTKDDFKANTKHHRIKLLKPFYNEAVRQNWILLNPLYRIENPKREQVIPFTLTVQQMKALLQLPDLNTVIGIRDRMMFELMYCCGLRKEEVSKVCIDDFSEDYRRLKIKGKGGNESMLYVGKMSAHFLKFYIENIYTHLKNKGTKYLLTSLKTGNALPARWIEKITISYGNQLGLKAKLLPHCFRYSVATHLSEEGADLRLIQAFLRHASPETTTRYIRADFQRLKDVHAVTHPREVLH